MINDEKLLQVRKRNSMSTRMYRAKTQKTAALLLFLILYYRKSISSVSKTTARYARAKESFAETVLILRNLLVGGGEDKFERGVYV
jgi:hypothetical protein